MELQEYKCPNCGGALQFDSAEQKLKCPFCDALFSVSDFEKNDEVLDETEETAEWAAPAGEWQEGEADGIRVYVCRSCGGEIVGDENTAAASCPYCGNPVVMMGNFSGELKPDLVIPFRLDKKAAMASLEKHLSGKRLLPKIFSSQSHIDEIKGIYVPFWLFDAGAHADIRYRATRTRHWSDANYEYTETRYYDVFRSGDLAFDYIPVDGSSKMPDELMESLEPFDLSQAVNFKTAYLAGYLADKYDVSAESNMPRAEERIRVSTENAFARTVQGYSGVQAEESHIRVTDGRIRYALYPVWLLNTSWNGEKYTFAMNGQTGKFVGDLPMDKGAYWRWFGTLTGIGAAVTYAAALLLRIL